jgi:uncharacterized protein YkwD
MADGYWLNFCRRSSLMHTDVLQDKSPSVLICMHLWLNSSATICAHLRHAQSLQSVKSVVIHPAKSMLVLLCVLCACAVNGFTAHAQTPEKLDALQKLNEARRANGAPALAWSALLDKAAQRHSADMASKGFVDEVGSDGSTPRQRVEAAGYPKWQGAQIWAESIYAGQSSFDEALNFILSEDGQRRTLLGDRVREVGIGIAKDNLRTYWTITYGAQPGVLPIFINEGAPATNDRNVAVQLTQENAVPNGEGNINGRVVEVRLGSTPDLSRVAWQPWEPLLPFTLARGAGEKTVFAEMRDGAGRTAMSSDSIVYDPNSRPGVRPVAPGNAASSNSQASSPTEAPLPTPTVVAIGLNAVVTLPPEPTGTVASASAPSTTQGATPAAVMMVIAPTSTAAPPAQPTAPSDERGIASSFVELPTPDTPAVRQFDAGAPAIDWLLPLYAVAQIGVIAIALMLFIRRK